MAVIEVETDRRTDPVVSLWQIGAISAGNERLHIIKQTMTSLVGGLVIPKFDAIAEEDAAPAHLVLNNEILVLTHHREFRGKLSRRTLRFSGIEYATRTFQPVHRAERSHHLTSEAISILEPANGPFAGFLLGEVHLRPVGNNPIDPETVRPLGAKEYSLMQNFAATTTEPRAA